MAKMDQAPTEEERERAKRWFKYALITTLGTFSTTIVLIFLFPLIAIPAGSTATTFLGVGTALTGYKKLSVDARANTSNQFGKVYERLDDLEKTLTRFKGSAMQLEECHQNDLPNNGQEIDWESENVENQFDLLKQVLYILNETQVEIKANEQAAYALRRV